MSRYFSMFSGVGGFELGIGNLAECIGYSEIDKYAIKTYERHYKHDNYGDATTIDERQLPDFDLLVGGFPCQAFSIAGKRKGFDDTRGTLFFDIARVLKHKRPRHLVLENVKGLLSHDSGKTFQTILGVLADLGYGVEWQILNGKRWVPQNRERVVIIGHLREECGRKILPFTEANHLANEKYKPRVQESEVAQTVTATYWKGGKDSHIEQVNQPKHSNDRVYGNKGISPALNTMQGGRRQPKILAPNGKEVDLSQAPPYPTQLLEVRTELGKKTRREIRQAEGRDSTKRGKGDKKYIPKTEPIANALTTGKENIEKWVIDMPRIRRLTPLECERLMGWPDNWTEGVSDTQRYKQCGNGIIAPMVTEVITALCNEGCLQAEGIS